MATVEELRERLLEGTRGISTICMPRELDSLIAKAREEGAEQEREKILAGSKAIGDTEIDDFPISYEVPAPVLSPAPKEADNGNK